MGCVDTLLDSSNEAGESERKRRLFKKWIGKYDIIALQETHGNPYDVKDLQEAHANYTFGSSTLPRNAAGVMLGVSHKIIGDGKVEFQVLEPGRCIVAEVISSDLHLLFSMCTSTRRGLTT